MKKIIISILIFLFAFSVLAKTDGMPASGLTPDSPFYFLKSWKESIQTFFTFGAENKAKQYLHLSEVRLAEYQKMVEKGKTEIAEKTLKKYEKQLNNALEKTEELKNKGKDVKDLSQKIEEAIIKHLEVLQENLQKVPEQAKKGIENAIENSQKQIEKITGKKDETANWKTYRNEKWGFEFKYPEKLKLIEEGNKVILNHSIPYENYGDCDMIGGGKLYKTLDDFNVSLELIPQKITLKYVDGEYSAGDLDGSWAYEGAEGCGDVKYYFPVKENKTLVVQKAAVQALSGISTVWDLEEILKIPDVVSKEESDKIFNQILSTFKFISQ